MDKADHQSQPEPQRPMLEEYLRERPNVPERLHTSSTGPSSATDTRSSEQRGASDGMMEELETILEEAKQQTKEP